MMDLFCLEELELLKPKADPFAFLVVSYISHVDGEEA